MSYVKVFFALDKKPGKCQAQKAYIIEANSSVVVKSPANQDLVIYNDGKDLLVAKQKFNSEYSIEEACLVENIPIPKDKIIYGLEHIGTEIAFVTRDSLRAIYVILIKESEDMLSLDYYDRYPTILWDEKIKSAQLPADYISEDGNFYI